MNATDNHEYVLDSPYDESNADDFDEVDEISSMKIPFSENEPLQNKGGRMHSQKLDGILQYLEERYEYENND
jgi:hypothetical protein